VSGHAERPFRVVGALPGDVLLPHMHWFTPVLLHTLVHAYFTTHALGLGALAGDNLLLHTYLLHTLSEWSEPLQVMMSGKPNVYLMCIYRVPNVYLLRVEPLQVMSGKPNVYLMCIYCVPKKGQTYFTYFARVRGSTEKLDHAQRHAPGPSGCNLLHHPGLNPKP
jgi:hypothetical protein